MRVSGRFATAICIATLSVGITGCGLIRQQEIKERNAALKQQSEAATQQCDAKLPSGNPKIAVARAKCQVDAYNIMRPAVTYPDLMDLFLTRRMVVAEQVEKGQITVAQANELIAAKQSEIVAEEQRRNLANRSVAAQESAAGPVSCTRFGNTVSCY
jgi:hypothetical protein